MAENKKKVKNDIIFIVAVVLLIGLAAGAMLLFREEGGAVEVKVDGKLYGTYSLSKDQTIQIISGKNGEFYNVLVIEGGKAYVKEANCPGADTYYNKCTNKKPIHYTGESILCKEHGVVIAIIGGEEGGPDFNV